jgi:hypothetical protein
MGFSQVEQQASKPPKKGADRDPKMSKRSHTAFFIFSMHTAFFIFSMEVCYNARQDHAGFSFAGLSKHIVTLWKEMDPEEKQRFLNLTRTRIGTRKR